jgi:recombination protein RecA
MFGRGIDRLGDLVDLATNAAVLEKSGAWLSYKEHRLGQGRDKTREFLATQPDLVAQIEKDVTVTMLGRDAIALPAITTTTTAEGDESTAAPAVKPSASATSLSGAGPTEPANRIAPAKPPDAVAEASPPKVAEKPAEKAEKQAEKPAGRSSPVVTRKTLPPRPFAKR